MFPSITCLTAASEAGHKPALAADRLPTRFCRSDVAGFVRPACHCDDLVARLPTVKLQEQPASRMFLLTEAVPDSFTDSGSMTARAAALSEPWLGSSRDGKPAQLRRCCSSLQQPTHSAAAATALGRSFAATSSHNTATPRKGY